MASGSREARRVAFRARLDAADSATTTAHPEAPALLLSPTYDPRSSSEEQGRSVAVVLSEMTRA
eukprot:4471063-Alexandrium_andersonii.AAC.1